MCSFGDRSQTAAGRIAIVAREPSSSRATRDARDLRASRRADDDRRVGLSDSRVETRATGPRAVTANLRSPPALACRRKKSRV